MSTSPKFKYRGPDKRCPFPFAREAASVPYSNYRDYVTLTPSGGDEGLAEACRLWWLLDSMVLTPSGTITAPSPYGNSASFGPEHVITLSSTNEPNERVSLSNQDLLGDFLIAYVASEWRMYYSFYFDLVEPIGETEFMALFIVNPYGRGSSIADSGSLSFSGYTLNWVAITQTSFGSDPALSGCGLTIDPTFYTLV